MYVPRWVVSFVGEENPGLRDLNSIWSSSGIFFCFFFLKPRIQFRDSHTPASNCSRDYDQVAVAQVTSYESATLTNLNGWNRKPKKPQLASRSRKVHYHPYFTIR